MNDKLFTHGFIFRTIEFDKFHYTDNRVGAPNHYFAYMICGRCKIKTDSQTIHINEGDIFYIPDKCSYQSYWYGEPKIKFISLGFQCMPNFENLIYPVQVIPHNAKAVELLYRLSDKSQLSAGDIGVFYTLAGILIPLMTHSMVCRSIEVVENAKEYLIHHPYAKTGEIAQNCAISEAALYLAFRKSSDITLNQLRNNLLLEKAKGILITTDKSVEYVSDILGFSSTSYFRKKFKQHFNVTPSEMRRRYKI